MRYPAQMLDIVLDFINMKKKMANILTKPLALSYIRRGLEVNEKFEVRG